MKQPGYLGVWCKLCTAKHQSEMITVCCTGTLGGREWCSTMANKLETKANIQNSCKNNFLYVAACPQSSLSQLHPGDRELVGCWGPPFEPAACSHAACSAAQCIFSQVSNVLVFLKLVTSCHIENGTHVVGTEHDSAGLPTLMVIMARCRYMYSFWDVQGPPRAARGLGGCACTEGRSSECTVPGWRCSAVTVCLASQPP